MNQKSSQTPSVAANPFSSAQPSCSTHHISKADKGKKPQFRSLIIGNFAKTIECSSSLGHSTRIDVNGIQAEETLFLCSRPLAGAPQICLVSHERNEEEDILLPYSCNVLANRSTTEMVILKLILALCVCPVCLKIKPPRIFTKI